MECTNTNLRAVAVDAAPDTTEMYRNLILKVCGALQSATSNCERGADMGSTRVFLNTAKPAALCTRVTTDNNHTRNPDSIM